MLCPRCYGKHVVLSGSGWMPCPECAGAGALHCCDGLPEPDRCEAAAAPAEPPVATRPPSPRVDRVR